MLVPTCLGLAILSFVWISIQSTTGLIVFSVFYGFFIGAFMTLPFSSVVRLSPDIGEVGTRMGMVGGVASIGLLIGTPMGGAILRHAGWTVLQSVGGAILVASAIAILASRVAKGGCRLTTKV
jgi:MFS family permease